MSYSYMSFKDELSKAYGGKEVTLVTEAFAGDYEWTEARVYKVGQAYYFAEASGCSCTTYEDEVFVDDFTEFSTKRALMVYLRNNKNLSYFADELLENLRKA